jgi:hypothetical protein
MDGEAPQKTTHVQSSDDASLCKEVGANKLRQLAGDGSGVLLNDSTCSEGEQTPVVQSGRNVNQFRSTPESLCRPSSPVPSVYKISKIVT